MTRFPLFKAFPVHLLAPGLLGGQQPDSDRAGATPGRRAAGPLQERDPALVLGRHRTRLLLHSHLEVAQLPVYRVSFQRKSLFCVLVHQSLSQPPVFLCAPT